MKLYGCFRSPAAYRGRLALNLEHVQYEAISIDLLAGAQAQPD